MTVNSHIPVSAAVKGAWPSVSVAALEVATGPADRLAAVADRIWHEQHTVWSSVSRGDIRRHPHVRAYRDFVVALGLDPDRQPPSIQGLIDRGLRGKPPGRWPRVDPVVDLLNAVAVQTMVALGAFDADRLTGPVRLDLTSGGEPFHPLGGEESALPAGRLVLADDLRVLSLFAQRDGVHQAIRPDSGRVLVLGCAVPQVDATAVGKAVELAAGLLAG